METTFVNDNPEVTRFADLIRAPRHLEHPFEDYLAYLRESQALVERSYQLEKACAFDGHGSAEGRDFIRHRLAAGSQMLLDLWYTAWLDSATEPEAWHPQKHEPSPQCAAGKDAR
jgi:hypothetical protein